MALLLTLVPNLEGLSFILPHSSRYPEQIIAHAAFESVPPSLFSFPRLSHVSYAPCVIEEDGFGPSDMSIYFFLPAMRVIEGWQCVESGPGLSQKRWSLPQKKSKVISIELINSQIGKDSIANLLGACEALESLTLACHSFMHEQEALAYLEVCRGLQSVQSSLKQFRLDTELCGFQDKFSAPMPSFNTFLKMECLNLELDFLLGPDPARAPQLVDVLPTSITSLTLRYGEGQCEGWNRQRLAPLLQELARCSKDKFPRLKKVELIRFSDIISLVEKPFDINEWEDWNHFGVSSVAYTFQNAGIDFSYQIF